MSHRPILLNPSKVNFKIPRRPCASILALKVRHQELCVLLRLDKQLHLRIILQYQVLVRVCVSWQS